MISGIGFSAHPTEFKAAIRASHMVAALSLLHLNFAFWTKIDVISVNPALELLIKLRFAITVIVKFAAAFETYPSLAY